uniref:Uncharacterized protein LOC104241042 n=1 Tax=Nicotiana sylvestris TaxID=4096 RepID=A0A1U7XXA8_NICSY
MKAFDDEVVELAAYQLRDVAGAWLAKHAPHMVKIEKAKIRRFVGGLAYHIKDTTSAAAVGMTAFSSVVEFAKHLEKDIQQRRDEKEHNKKARTVGRFNGISSGGRRDSSNKESIAPDQSSHQSGGGSSFRRTQSYGNHGRSTRPSSSSATVVAPLQARGSHNQTTNGAGRGADRVTQGEGQPPLFATLDRQSAEPSVEVITSSTFSYVTPYFAINLGLEPEQLSESFLVSTLVGESSVEFSGHLVSSEGIKVDPQKIEAVKNWPRPTTPTEIRNFFRLEEIEERGITAYALAQSSLVADVKAKQDEDSYLVKLKEGIKNKEITTFTLGSDGVLKFNDRLCVPDVDGLRKAIMEESHSSRYSIHPDRLTKSVHFLPIKMTDSAEQYAQFYIKEIVRLHGTPVSIISDRGPQFKAHF